MNSRADETKLAHVFIASTAGLVSISAIAQRNGQSLPSLVTIAGGSKVASITASYRQFVAKDTSPLPDYFDDDSYHMVISQDIHHGESWQLACSTAHLLHQQSCLGDANVMQGDTIIIASGTIDAASHFAKGIGANFSARRAYGGVGVVTHLAQKCLRAQAQVRQWQQMHCDVIVLVPEANYRQPLPDIAFPLMPVASMQDVKRCLSDKNIITWADSDVSLVQESVGSSSNQIKPSTLLLPLAEFGAALASRSRTALETKWTPASSANGTMKKYARMLVMAFMFLFSIGFISQFLFKEARPPNIALSYSLNGLGEHAQPSNNSDMTMDTITVEPIVINYEPSAIVQLQTLELSKLDDLYIDFQFFEKAPQDAYLVTDSYALIKLARIGEDGASFRIPIPSWQKADRHYTLMAMQTVMDESDEQSLRHYLETLHEQSLKPDAINLSTWTNKQGYSVKFVEQSLIR
ncbi:hypothetical protein PN836_001755 [Ningiella sp. W23]|uniref:hypothetical protein n=1 Tax=Ningiella sp. W23 TaxID=3023715 RepID=UPI0037578CBD